MCGLFFLGLSLLLKESGPLILVEEPGSSAETGVFAGAKTLAAAHVQALGGAKSFLDSVESSSLSKKRKNKFTQFHLCHQLKPELHPQFWTKPLLWECCQAQPKPANSR